MNKGVDYFGCLVPDELSTIEGKLERQLLNIRVNPLGRSWARWIMTRPRVEVEYECSNCHKVFPLETNYCSHCGCIMEDEKSNAVIRRNMDERRSER